MAKGAGICRTSALSKWFAGKRERGRQRWMLEKSLLHGALWRPGTKTNREREAICRSYIDYKFKDRPDLQGLPVLMGGACRMEPGTSTQFGVAIGAVRNALRAEETTLIGEVDPASQFWDQWAAQDTGAGAEAHLLKRQAQPRRAADEILQEEKRADRRKDQPPRV